MRLSVLVAAGVMLAGCAGTKKQVKQQEPGVTVGERAYVNRELGFQLSRPSGTWNISTNNQRMENGIALPVVLNDEETGAQVVIQVAPAVATPSQYAERINSGLREQPGFVAGDLQPLPVADGAVGFPFEVGDAVEGRVAVRSGSPGSVLMLLATWPKAAGPVAALGVDAILDSLEPMTK